MKFIKNRIINPLIVKIGQIIFKLNYINESNIIENSDKVKIHPTAKIAKTIINGKVNIEEEVKIFHGVYIHSESQVNIGRFSSINGPNTSIYCSLNHVKIGSFCSIARDVTMQEYNHNFNHISTYYMGNILGHSSFKNDIISNGPIIIESDVWIGAKSVILSGTTIGQGSVIGANSVVKGNIPPYSIVAGSPAKVLRKRFEQPIIDILIDLKWYDWPIDKIKKYGAFFDSNINIESLNELKLLVINEN